MSTNFGSSTVSSNQQATAAQYNALRKDAIQNGGDYATSGGSANAYTLAIDAQITAYAAGQVFKFKANFQNTSAATLNVNSIGAKTIKKNVSTDLAPGDIQVDQIVTVVYDGTNLQMLGGVGSSSTFDFGTGADGDATISGATSLSRDMYYNNLTVTNTFTLNPSGYRIFVKGVLNNQAGGTIARNGNAGGTGSNGSGTNQGAGGAAGTALAGGTIEGSIAGAVGGHGSDGGNSGSLSGQQGLQPAAISNTIGVAGSGSGAGGKGQQNAGTVGTAGLAGDAGTITAAKEFPYTYQAAYNLSTWLTSTTFTRLFSSQGGAGGGGGSGAAGNGITGGGGGGGGGGGSSGGIVAIFARHIINAGTISAIGGAGGAGGNGVSSGGATGGGGGGGAGGSGGVIILVYQTLTNTGTISVAGGTGGAAGNNANTAPAAGSAGQTGVIYQIQL